MAQNVIINGVTYQNVPEVDIPKSGGGTAKFYDTALANIAAVDVLIGKKAYGANGEIDGSMPNNGSTSGTISTKAGTVSVPAGYTTGGTISISLSEQEKSLPQTSGAASVFLASMAALLCPPFLRTAHLKFCPSPNRRWNHGTEHHFNGRILFGCA